MSIRLSFPIVVGGVVVLAAAAAYATLNQPESEAAQQATDDAYVQADLTAMAPQVAGVIAEVPVQDNQAVQAGQLLVRLDDRDLRVALDAAKAQVASAQASLEVLEAQIQRQNSEVQQVQANLSADEATLQLAQANRSRFTQMAQDGSGTEQARQQAEAQWQQASAARLRNQAAVASAQAQLGVLKAEHKRAQAALASAQAAQAGAELKLSYTLVKAPVAGVVAAHHARVGSYAQTGQPLLTLVPKDALYVEAHFRETQLARIQVGQAVSLRVDALPGVLLRAHVASLGPASGVSLSPLPAHNATGNFTKIVQRLPVRIELEPGQDVARQLRVGMSVRPQIETLAAPAKPTQPEKPAQPT